MFHLIKYSVLRKVKNFSIFILALRFSADFRNAVLFCVWKHFRVRL